MTCVSEPITVMLPACAAGARAPKTSIAANKANHVLGPERGLFSPMPLGFDARKKCEDQWQILLPKGESIIAQCFNIGRTVFKMRMSPEGTTDQSRGVS